MEEGGVQEEFVLELGAPLGGQEGDRVPRWGALASQRVSARSQDSDGAGKQDVIEAGKGSEQHDREAKNKSCNLPPGWSCASKYFLFCGRRGHGELRPVRALGAIADDLSRSGNSQLTFRRRGVRSGPTLPD